MKKPWYRTAILAIAWVMAMPALPVVLLVFASMGAYCGLVNLVSEFKFYRRMARCKRFLSRRKLSQRIEQLGPGTLILDSPSIGWGYSHAWWTSDKAWDAAPTGPPTHDEYCKAVESETLPGWNKWHWDNYTNPETGSAFLLRVWNSKPIEKWVTTEHPNTKILHTWSGLIHVAQHNAR